MGITIFSRTNRGILITTEGSEFLGYARQVVEQADLLENRYIHTQSKQQHFSVSAQHYAFAVSAFVRLLKEYDRDEYEFTLREQRRMKSLLMYKIFEVKLGFYMSTSLIKRLFISFYAKEI